MTELLANIVLALRSKDKNQIEKAYNLAARCGMDRMTANILLRDRTSQIEIYRYLKENGKI